MEKKYGQLYIFLPALLILFAGAVFLLVKNYYHSDELLWRYAPKKSVAFMELNLADKKFVDYLGKNSQAKKQLENFLQDNGLPVGIWQAGIEIKKIGLFVVEVSGQDKRKERGWIINSRNNVAQLSAFFSGYYYHPVNNKLAIITKSKEAMQAVREAQYFSDLNFEKRNRNAGGFGLGFFRTDFWSDANLTNEEKIIFQSSFTSDDDGLIYWQAAINNKEEIDFQISLPWAAGDNQLAWQKDAAAGDVFFSNKSLVLKVEGMKNVWKAIAVGAKSAVLDRAMVETYIGDKYQTNIKELYKIFEQPFTLVIRPKIKIKQPSNFLSLEHNDFVVLSKQLPSADKAAVIENLEALIKNYTAFQFPEKRWKILVDGTKGYEVVADPSRFIFTQESYERGELRFIRAADFELGYFLSDEKIMIFNSVVLAKSVLDQPGIGAEDNEAGGVMADLIFDPEILDMPYLSFAKAIKIFFSDNVRKEIVIRGAIR